MIVDVHSYPTARLPYELHGDGPRPQVCLGTDSFHTPPELVTLAEKAFAILSGVGIDRPVLRRVRPAALLREGAAGHRPDGGDPDTYMSEPGGPTGPGFSRLASALTALVDAMVNG